MQYETDGIVIREVKVRESDRIVTLLTRQRGVVSASARGSLGIRNKLSSATGLLTYADFSLYRGKTMYRLDAAAAKDVFFELRADIGALSLGLYMAELTSLLAPAEAPADEFLDYLLLGLSVLRKGDLPVRQVKAVYELGLLSAAGYMPNLVACRQCAAFEGGPFYFDVENGELLCGACSQKAALAPNITPSVLAAMRHIVFSEGEKSYRFALGKENLQILSRVAGAYVQYHIDKPLKTGDFLQKILTEAEEETITSG